MQKAMRAALIGAAAALWACGGTSAPAVPTDTGGGGTTGSVTAGSSASASTGTTGIQASGSTASSASGSTGSTSSSTSSSGSTGGSTTGVTTGPGPWPTQALTQYGPAQGLTEPLVDVSTDEAQNIWAVSSDALYVMRPGDTAFRRYTDADGLHIANSTYPGVMNVAGGKPGEAFVGYNGAEWENGSPQVTGDPSIDAVLNEGGIDHVQLNADGTLTVIHPDIHSNDYVVGSETDFSFKEDRSTRRMLYDHYFHDGTLYIGWNHGVSRFDWAKTDPTTGSNFADHVHPIVTSTASDGTVTEWMGEWRGLALDPAHDGMLWMGGQYTGGALAWTPTLYGWTCQRADCANGGNPFVHAWAMAWGGPLFPVSHDGDSMNIRGVAVTHDGTAYFASGPQWNPGVDHMYGVAVVKPEGVTYLDPGADLHLPSNYLMDVVAMPDDTLVFAVMGNGLFRYNPQTGQTAQMAGVPGDVNLIYLDKMVEPAALYAATGEGIFVVRDQPK